MYIFFNFGYIVNRCTLIIKYDEVHGQLMDAYELYKQITINIILKL